MFNEHFCAGHFRWITQFHSDHSYEDRFLETKAERVAIITWDYKLLSSWTGFQLGFVSPQSQWSASNSDSTMMLSSLTLRCAMQQSPCCLHPWQIHVDVW